MTIVKNQWQNPFDDTESSGKLWKSFVKKIRKFGFDSHIVFTHSLTRVRETGIYTNNNRTTMKANNFTYYTDTPIERKVITEHFLRGSHINNDALAYHIFANGTTAIVGKDFLDKAMPNYKEAKRFWTAPEDYKLRNALVIPFIKNSELTPNAFGFHSTMEPDDLVKMIDENIERILLLCQQFMPRFHTLYRAELAKEAGITKRQLEILKMVCFGLSNAEISAMLEITEATVSFHLAGIKEKLQISSNREIPLAAIRLGFVELASA